MQEETDRKNRVENKAKKDRIAALIAEKQDENLKCISEEDLQKLYSSL